MEIIQKLRKRDGRIVEFDLNRIVLAASKALKAAGTANDKIADKIGHDVLEALVKQNPADGIVDIEKVQDAVEQAFIRRGLSKAAKAYILYRAQHEKMRGHKQLMLDVQELMTSYLGHEDWRVNENSNAGYS